SKRPFGAAPPAAPAPAAPAAGPAPRPPARPAARRPAGAHGLDRPRYWGDQAWAAAPSHLNCVMFGVGGLGYFLTASKYSSTTLSAGPDTQPNRPATTRSSRGSILIV